MLTRTLATVVTATGLTIVLALFLSGQVLADSWKDESGHGKWAGRGHYEKEHHSGGHWKREYRDGNCKIEEKSGPGGYKKEIKCDRGHDHAPLDVAWLVDRAFSDLAPGEPIVWQDPAGSEYRVVPTRDYRTPQGRYCREYQATATVGGRPQQTYGTACLQPDGSWQIVQ